MSDRDTLNQGPKEGDAIQGELVMPSGWLKVQVIVNKVFNVGEAVIFFGDRREFSSGDVLSPGLFGIIGEDLEDGTFRVAFPGFTLTKKLAASKLKRQETKCPAGHPLTPLVMPRNGFCRRCGKSIFAAESCMACRACEFDLCSGCFGGTGAMLQKKELQQAPQTVSE